MKKKVYISGPISGLKRQEYLCRFADVEGMLKRRGLVVVNPTRLAPCRWSWIYRLIGYRLTLAYDLWWLRRCQYIYMMWLSEKSLGSRLERRKAREWGIEEIEL